MGTTINHIIKYVAIYLRKSQGEVDEDLIKHRLLLTDICKRNNWVYVEYAEIGTSDSIDMRPKMISLLIDVENGLYDGVLVVDQDRLGRGDMGELDRIKKVFQQSDTLIIEPHKICDLNSDEDDTYFDFKGLIARQEYKQICKRLKRGKKIGSQLGQWTNGTPPYPYEYEEWHDKRNKKGLVVNDNKLAVYRKIINMALDRQSTAQIAVSLNQEHIPAPRGGTWCNVTINRLLIDETHLGKIISNKSMGDGHKVKKSNSKPLKKIPKSEWVVVENCHEAVKTPEEHATILSLLDERTLIPVKARKHSFSLSGLVKCKVCGHGLTFVKSSNGSMYLKSCWYHDPYGKKCINSGVQYDFLEQLIISEVSKLESVETIHHDEDKKSLDNLLFQKATKETTIEKLKKAIERINEAFEFGDYSREEWLKSRGIRNSELITAQGELFDLDSRIKDFSSITDEQRKQNIRHFLDNITELTTQQERNNLFSTIISKISWYKQGKDIEIDIEYK